MKHVDEAPAGLKSPDAPADAPPRSEDQDDFNASLRAGMRSLRDYVRSRRKLR